MGTAFMSVSFQLVHARPNRVTAIALSWFLFAAGIGLFLALIALKNAGIVVGNPATLVAHGDLTSWPVVMAALGFALIVALEYHKVIGGVIIGQSAFQTGALAASVGSTESTAPVSAAILGLVLLDERVFFNNAFEVTAVVVSMIMVLFGIAALARAEERVIADATATA